MHPVHHPPVPSAIPIHEQLTDGCKIDVHGRVSHGHHKDFSIELLSGPHIVLHVNFRFHHGHHHEHTVVINSCDHGVWGPEVRHHNPLHHDEHFHFHIHVHHTHYDIDVNGHRLASFHHRFPAHTVQALGLKGGVHVEKVNFEGFHFRRDWNAPMNYGHAGFIGYGTTSYAPPTAIPTAVPIYETLRPGCKIDVHGRVNHGHHKNFAVELLSGPHIVLHVNFRFHHEHEVVMNSASHGAWGAEVRHHNPLHHDDTFHLHIHAHVDYYEIEVNGHHLANYPHRFPMASVQALGLKGDVTVERVEFSGFDFGIDWSTHHHHHDFGHAGYDAYGTEHYQPPTFHESHAYNAYF
ncbi:hypothetical protein Q1695_001451 [Nippostrongylus brasiliensis]|nr:hypothetical protein Q1695_001451 [Nippostrongylus brasiliensis]